MKDKATRIKKKIRVNQASVIVTTPSVVITRHEYSQTYANNENMEVTPKTLTSRIFFGSSTAITDTALITSRLKAADPTIVEAPSGPAGSPRVPRASMT